MTNDSTSLARPESDNYSMQFTQARGSGGKRQCGAHFPYWQI